MNKMKLLKQVKKEIELYKYKLFGSHSTVAIYLSDMMKFDYLQTKDKFNRKTEKIEKSIKFINKNIRNDGFKIIIAKDHSGFKKIYLQNFVDAF